MVDRTHSLDSGAGARAGELKARALDAAASAREKLSGGSRTLRDYIIKEPTRALGIALGVGVLLGWLIKRR